MVLLSDHSPLTPCDLSPVEAAGRLFQLSEADAGGLLAGRDQPLQERLDWGRMRMDPSDVSDVTGATYRYLVNGHGPADNWTGLFSPGERVRLRW